MRIILINVRAKESKIKTKKYFYVLYLNMLTACVIGREFAQSDSLMTHTFSTVVSYNEVMLICDFAFIFDLHDFNCI